ncbi:hypothetical protein IH992_14985 [Candidatus Poribacteria bacterium]|nr:hypothetical protein [Candidatus Poribacteria bacterium]
MNKHIIVVDDFYIDANETRAGAMAMPFDQEGNYPGKRTQPFTNNSMQTAMENLINHPIAQWGGFPNGSFQITTSHDRTWIHSDETTGWAGLVYLTPNAPHTAGTAFFEHIGLGLIKSPNHNDEQRLDMKLGEIYDRVSKDSQDFTKWRMTDRIANRFNRLVLYDSRLYHASCDYFGDNLENGRLFQVFFFTT